MMLACNQKRGCPGKQEPRAVFSGGMSDISAPRTEQSVP
jgi:hypothetical protein